MIPSALGAQCSVRFRQACVGQGRSPLPSRNLAERDLSGVLPRLWSEDRKVPQLPSKAPFSKRFEDVVGMACESAAARQVARRFGLPASTVRAIDKRYLERWVQRP